MKNIFIVAFTLMIGGTFYAQEKQENHLWSSDRPDGHAPISVMGDHTHHKNEWMLSYRYMNMLMKDLQSDGEEINEQMVFENYMVAPKQMQMHMHMLGIMYAPSDKLTLMTMFNYLSNNMDLTMRMMGMDTDFSTRSSGLSDIKIAALYQFFNKNHQTFHGKIGFSLPTGSIETKDETAMSEGNEVLLPYPMQLGSGSFQTEIGLTYLWQKTNFSGGVQLNGLINLHENTEEYQTGNQYLLTSWLAYKTSDFLSLSGRIKAMSTERIEGKHPDLMPMMVTTANTENSGGIFVGYGLGANVYLKRLKGLRLGAEINLPLYQKLNGIQLQQQRSFTIGTQYSF
ncbi:transporter [Mesonia sp. K7]|uniref:transporter n=1 Tax=Mesonia sp. K7 TaxID=2218606 RepID=UPI000DA903CA|nr:transporter [Mesonia sp. K7]PZD77719.1 transporter [Mesonia sp. K7]